MSDDTSTTVGRLRNAVQFVADLGLPADVGVGVHGDGVLSLHPRSSESRRRVMNHPLFTRAAWDVLSSGTSTTFRRGVTVWLHRAHS